MSCDVDYQSIAIPEESAPEEYTYVERRAEELQLLLETGHPRALNQTELAERYGVSQQQISKDFSTLSEYVAETLGDEYEFTMETVLHGAMLTLIKEGKSYRAPQVARWPGGAVSGSNGPRQSIRRDQGSRHRIPSETVSVNRKRRCSTRLPDTPAPQKTT